MATFLVCYLPNRFVSEEKAVMRLHVAEQKVFFDYFTMKDAYEKQIAPGILTGEVKVFQGRDSFRFGDMEDVTELYEQRLCAAPVTT